MGVCVSVGFRKLQSSILDVVTKRDIPIGAKDFAGSVTAFRARSSMLALLVRLKCLTCSCSGGAIGVPGGRIETRCIDDISISS